MTSLEVYSDGTWISLDSTETETVLESPIPDTITIISGDEQNGVPFFVKPAIKQIKLITRDGAEVELNGELIDDNGKVAIVRVGDVIRRITYSSIAYISELSGRSYHLTRLGSEPARLTYKTESLTWRPKIEIETNGDRQARFSLWGMIDSLLMGSVAGNVTLISNDRRMKESYRPAPRSMMSKSSMSYAQENSYSPSAGEDQGSSMLQVPLGQNTIPSGTSKLRVYNKLVGVNRMVVVDLRTTKSHATNYLWMLAPDIVPAGQYQIKDGIHRAEYSLQRYQSGERIEMPMNMSNEISYEIESQETQSSRDVTSHVFNIKLKTSTSSGSSTNVLIVYSHYGSTFRDIRPAQNETFSNSTRLAWLVKLNGEGGTMSISFQMNRG